MLQINKFIVLNISFKKRALQIGFPRDKNRNCGTNEKLEIGKYVIRPRIEQFSAASIWRLSSNMSMQYTRNIDPSSASLNAITGTSIFAVALLLSNAVNKYLSPLMAL
jgi:hypothetical protein